MNGMSYNDDCEASDRSSPAIATTVAQLGAGPLTEEAVAKHIHPLFSRTLAGSQVYLASHTLGRPIDQMHADVSEGARLWSEFLRDAWTPWLLEEQSYRSALAALLGMERPDCVVPKTSAGQALRAVLNILPVGATVLTTKDEFASVSVVLAQYAAVGRLQLRFASPNPDGRWTAECVTQALQQEPGVRLVVVSQVFYANAQVFADLPALAAACHKHGAELLVDCYHSLGVLPMRIGELGCDYLIGGCYKYLRGGPGAAFLALAPHIADGGVQPLDIGWFAQEPGSDAWQQSGPALRKGGDAWLEGTPAVLPYYQARSGLLLTRALGVDRLRAYSLGQLQFLREILQEHGIASQGGDAKHGGFLTIPAAHEMQIVKQLGEQGIVVDARNGCVRVCPDCLTTRAELEHAAAAIASCYMP